MLRPPPGMARWGLALLALLLLCGALWLQPALLPNENVYLDSVRGTWRDLLAGRTPAALGRGDTRLVFHVLAGPPVHHLGLLAGAVVVRLACWLAVLVPLAGLSRALGLRPLAFLAGAALWIVAGQSLMASEFILEGGESKVPAYGLVLGSLWAILAGRPALAGALAGGATAFHPLVGGWGGLALLAAAGRAGAPRFLGGAALVGVPALLPALLFGPGPLAPEEARLLATRRIPHHMDPFAFLTLGKAATALAAAAVAAAALGRGPALRFLGVLAALFAAGVAARALELWSFLVLYPFRMADVLLPLFALLGAALAAQRRRWALALGGLAVAAALMALHGPRVPSPLALARAWTDHARTGELSAFSPAAGWIREHTPAGAVFLAPPWLDEFRVESEREPVVRTKAVPHWRGFADWYRRVEDVLGSPAPLDGPSVRPEGRERYESLSWPRLQELSARYGASYYLVGRPRELPVQPAWTDGRWWVYPLQERPEGEGKPPP